MYSGTVTNWFLAAILLSNLVFLGLLIYAGLRLRFIITGFFTPASDNQPSPAGLILTGLTKQFSSALVDQIKVTLMGVNSGIVRAEKAATGEIATGLLSVLAQKHPLIAALASLGSVQKAIKRYPQPSMNILASFLGPAKNNGNNSSEAESSDQGKFEFE